MENNINLDLSKYSFMDLLISLILPSTRKPISDYNTEILTKIDNNIQKFNNINTDESKKLVKFFTNMKYVFFPSYMKNNNNNNNTTTKVIDTTESEKTVIYTKNKIKDEQVGLTLSTQKEHITTNQNINPTVRKEVTQLLNIDSKYRRTDDTAAPLRLFDLPGVIKNVTEITLNDFELQILIILLHRNIVIIILD